MNEKVKQALEELCDLASCGDLHFQTRHDVFTRTAGVEKYKPIIEIALNQAEENEKELIAEQHRLFDLAKEQENELKELREFARIVVEKSVDIDILKSYIHCDKLNGKDFDYNKYKTYNYAIFSKQKLTQAEFDLVKRVVEKYGQ